MRTVFKRISKKKIFFFFFSLLILFNAFFSINTNAFIPKDDLTIKSNWLYITKGSYRDFDPKDWKTNIKFSTGGKDLLSFENRGIISINESEVLFKSSIRFGFEANAYTNVDYKDVYPNIESKTFIANFLTVHKFMYSMSIGWEYYDVSWDSLVYGIEHEQIYDGILPITVGIKEMVPPTGVISVNGRSFSIPTYTYDITEVGILQVRDGEAGKYMDIFTDAAEIQEGTVSTEILGQDVDSGYKEIMNAVANWDLGWRAGQIVRGQTLQQSEIDTDPVGVSYDSIKFEQDTPFIFNLPVTLAPEVYEIIQDNTYRAATFTYEKSIQKLEVWTSPHTEIAPSRVVAVHTVNPFLHWDFYIDIDFYATMPVTAEVSQAILADPYLKRGDMVWDSDFTGVYDVIYAPTKGDPISNFFKWVGNLFSGLWGIIILIIIVAVGVFILIKVVPILLMRRAMRGRKNKF